MADTVHSLGWGWGTAVAAPPSQTVLVGRAGGSAPDADGDYSTFAPVFFTISSAIMRAVMSVLPPGA